jgi:hypothetical protein
MCLHMSRFIFLAPLVSLIPVLVIGCGASDHPADEGTVPSTTGGAVGSGGATAATGGAGPLATGGATAATGGQTNGTGGETAHLGVPASYPRGPSPGCGNTPPHPPATDPGYTYTMDTTPDAGWIEAFRDGEPDGADEYRDRKYRVRTPVGYDSTKPYPVSIMGGGCGGGNDSWGGLSPWARDDDSDVIHVHPAYKDGCYQDDGINNPEVVFMDAWWEEFINNYCVDLERVFITGFSSGSWESQTISCSFPGTIRGMGSASGGLRERRPECAGPVATIKGADAIDTNNPIHDTLDDSTCTGAEADGCWMGKVICTGSYATRDDFPDTDPKSCVDEGSALGRDLMLEMNGCVGTATEPWGGTIDNIPLAQGGLYRYPTFMHTEPGETVPQGDIDAVKDYFEVPADGKNNLPACHKYTGCPAEFPVVWCMTYDDNHSPLSRISERKGDDGRTGFERFFEDDVVRYPVP